MPEKAGRPAVVSASFGEQGEMERALIAAGIIEHSPSLAIRVKPSEAMWETVFVSRNIEKYGYSQEDFDSGALSWSDIVHPDDFAAIANTLRDYEKQGITSCTLYYRLQKADGAAMWICDNTTIVYDDDGAVQYYDCVLTDYSLMKKGLEKNDDNLAQQKLLNEILQSLHVVDVDQAFAMMFDRIGNYLGISRIALFMDTAGHTAGTAIYEWCNTGITSLISRGGGAFSFEYPCEPQDPFAPGEVLVRSYGDPPSPFFANFKRDEVLAEVAVPVYMGEERCGFICFDECVMLRMWRHETVTFLKNTAKLASAVLIRKKTIKALADSTKTLETVLGNMNSYLFVSDVETGRVIFANATFRRDFGNDWEGKTCKEFVCNGWSCPCKTCAKNSVWCEGVGYSELYLDTLEEWLGVTASYITWVDGRSVRLVDGQIITPQKLYEEDIKRLAFVDHLTGLPNRYRCDEDLQLAIEEAVSDNQIGYVIFLDLDDFKIINDSYGHDYGDAILIEFAAFLQNKLPMVDKVYRFGGDEFVLLMKGRNEQEVLQVVEKLLARAAQLWVTMDKQFYCTVSLGIVRYPDGNSSVKDVIKNADIAMYQVKKTGKNNYFFYTSELQNDSVRRVEMERIMRSSIQNDFKGFEVYFQPFVSLPEQKIVGAEALVRFRDEAGSMIMPDQFISLAEYLGLIVPIGDFVLGRAARLCKELNDNGFPEFQISVNVSIRQFQQRNFVKNVDKTLSASGVNYSNIIFEVTEGLAADDLQRMRLILNELRDKGIRLAMDDFGTGYSSLNNLRSLPIDLIKIDRTFIRDVTVDAYSNSFIRLITDLGHSLSKKICVEGVETAEQLQFCTETGANMIQGFYFCKPLPRAKFLEVLQMKTKKTILLPGDEPDVRQA